MHLEFFFGGDKLKKRYNNLKVNFSDQKCLGAFNSEAFPRAILL